MAIADDFIIDVVTKTITYNSSAPNNIYSVSDFYHHIMGPKNLIDNNFIIFSNGSGAIVT